MLFSPSVNSYNSLHLANTSNNSVFNAWKQEKIHYFGEKEREKERGRRKKTDTTFWSKPKSREAIVVFLPLHAGRMWDYVSLMWGGSPSTYTPARSQNNPVPHCHRYDYRSHFFTEISEVLSWAAVYQEQTPLSFFFNVCQYIFKIYLKYGVQFLFSS